MRKVIRRDKSNVKSKLKMNAKTMVNIIVHRTMHQTIKTTEEQDATARDGMKKNVKGRVSSKARRKNVHIPTPKVASPEAPPWADFLFRGTAG